MSSRSSVSLYKLWNSFWRETGRLYHNHTKKKPRLDGEPRLASTALKSVNLNINTWRETCNKSRWQVLTVLLQLADPFVCLFVFPFCLQTRLAIVLNLNNTVFNIYTLDFISED